MSFGPNSFPALPGVVAWLLAALLLTSCTSVTVNDPLREASIAEIELALNEGDLVYAEQELQRLRSSAPNDLAILLLSARLYALGGRTAEMQAVSERILAIDPASGFALEQLGLLRLSEGELDAAENYLTLAVAMEPLRWRAWNGLGVIADLRSRFELARSNFERALQIVPGHPKLLANLGWSRVLADDLPAAESLLRRALDLAPDAAATEGNLAFSIALQGRYEEAMALYESRYGKAIAANNVGYAAALRDDDRMARKYLSMALELMPNYYRKAANNLVLIEP